MNNDPTGHKCGPEDDCKNPHGGNPLPGDPIPPDPINGGNNNGGHRRGSGGDSANPEESILDKTAAYVGAWYKNTAWQADAWLYYHVPSGFTFSWLQVAGGYYGIAGSTTANTYVFNWRSMELDRYDYSSELGVGNTGLAVNVLGFGAINGASSNSSIEGSSLSFSRGLYGPLGGTRTDSISLKAPLDAITSTLAGKSPYATDPKSGLEITSSTLLLGLGIPGFTISGTTSITGSRENIFDINLPFNLIPPNNPYLP